MVVDRNGQVGKSNQPPTNQGLFNQTLTDWGRPCQWRSRKLPLFPCPSAAAQQHWDPSWEASTTVFQVMLFIMVESNFEHIVRWSNFNEAFTTWWFQWLLEGTSRFPGQFAVTTCQWTTDERGEVMTQLATMSHDCVQRSWPSTNGRSYLLTMMIMTHKEWCKLKSFIIVKMNSSIHQWSIML